MRAVQPFGCLRYRMSSRFRLNTNQKRVNAKGTEMRIESIKNAVWCVAVIVLMSFQFVSPAHAEEAEPVSKATFDQWMDDVSNWGRWGDDDQLGTLNLITPEVRKRAASLVKEGVPVSLAHNLIKTRQKDVSSPLEHTMRPSGVNNPGVFAGDMYQIYYHGYAHTHMDAVCHMFINGKLYNGFDQASVAEDGAQNLSIINAKQGVFTRGILFDIPKLKGVPYLEPRDAIYPADLEAWEKKIGTKVQSGDVVLIRTGRWARRDAKAPWNVSMGSAGLHASCAKWLKDRGAAILGSDAASDILPSPVEGISHPVHALVLVAMGMPIFDNCDLQALSIEAAKRERWEFLLTVSPLAVEGGTGSPMNPIAMF